MTKLYILDGPNKDKSFELKSDSTLIGRAPDNDIQIKDKSVSRNHLKLIRKGDQYFIRDLKSTNGTFVDGVKISAGVEFEVNEGVPISIGKSVICIGEGCLEEDQAFQDSIDLPQKPFEKDEEPLKARPFTFQKNMELMYKVCNVLMETLHINDILGKILDQILDLFKRIDRGVIILIDNETKAISKEIPRIKGGKKVSNRWYSLDLVNRVIKDGKAVTIPDVYVEEVDEFADTWRIMNIGSVMCVPLMSKSQIWGAIYVDSVYKAYGFRVEDLDLLTALGSPIALAIENAFLRSGENSKI